MFKKIFDLKVIHTYYQNQECPDLDIYPTEECQKILAGHRLIVKKNINGISVIAPVSSTGEPLIQFSEDLQFTFLLKIINKNFLDFTDFPDLNEPQWNPLLNLIYRFSNENIGDVGSWDLEKTIVKYLELKKYKDDNIVGFVVIYNNSSLPSVLNQSSEFKINFTAKEQYWLYYLVADSDTQNYTFLIQHNDNQGERIIFKRIDIAPNDKVLAVIKQEFPQSKQYLFKSKNEVSCQQYARGKIQLKKRKEGEDDDDDDDDDDVEVWIDNLPNPPEGNGIKVLNLQQWRW
ncbi:MAG: hypothetical protein QNJ54_14640 [Prochloraceae cyanobacterium]|nr:hypothetical protein [Prochloraceae cyanobacterium]